jgi:glycerol-3-phosphate O-acyltransferase
VRRGEPDPLYHAVLERFVQLLAGHGAVTGFFIEGGLSRDGALRKPRTGLLEYLIKLRKEFPAREIVFFPVALNYDRTLEDRYLVRERNGAPPRQMLLVRMWNLVAIAFWLPILIAANVLKVATRSHQKFGYAAISFGEPLQLSEWPGGSTLHELASEPRKEGVKALAEELLFRRIGGALPVTPMSLTCAALLEPGPADAAAVRGLVRELVARLRAAGAPFAFGQAFESIHRRRHSEKSALRMREFDAELLDAEEAELVVTLAMAQLGRRRIVRKGGVLTFKEADRPIVEYYANSIRHHL